MRVGILGAGYISDFHAKAVSAIEGIELVAVCDLNEVNAKKLLKYNSDIKIYNDYDRMLGEESLDVVHVLTQPESHFFLVKKAIEAGCHVVVEKPVTISKQEATTLKLLAKEHQCKLAINHNFLFSRPFIKLRKVINQGRLGPIKTIRVAWKKELAQAGFGPWDLWMLKDPKNVLFETGAHTVSELMTLVEKINIEDVSVKKIKTLPSGVEFYNRWFINGNDDQVNVSIEKIFDKGYDQHFVEVEGLLGVARADIENDVFSLDTSTGYSYDVERLSLNVRLGLSRVKQAGHTFMSYLWSKFKNNHPGAPYEASMIFGIENCYKELQGEAENNYSSIEFGERVLDVIEDISGKTKNSSNKPVELKLPRFGDLPKSKAEILVIGGSGFIGKKLLKALGSDSRNVRVLVRNPSSLLGGDIPDNAEVVVGDYRNIEFMENVLEGIEYVYHLAVSHGNSLEGYLKADSNPTIQLAELCHKKGIKRFVYTGTIDSLYLGPNAGVIKETDGVDSRIKRRNNYAHSKAITEKRLMALYETQDFPVVIVRPAIVLGEGGPVMHLGVANWLNIGRCEYWGKGENLLPTVLVTDVVDALIKVINIEGIEGKTYNLSSKPSINAKEYVQEVGDILGFSIQARRSHAFVGFCGDVSKWVIKLLAKHPDSKRIPSLRDWQCREQHASFDTTAAETDLNWHPVNNKDEMVEKGVRDTARHFLKTQL